MKNINIKHIIRESINNFIKENIETEDRTEFDDGTVEVDNYEEIAKLLDFKNPNDTVYFVQIVKRDKDNPGQKSKYNAAQYLKE